MHKYTKNNTKFVGCLAEKCFQYHAMLNGIMTSSPDNDMGRYDSLTDYMGLIFKTQVKCATVKFGKNGAVSYKVNTSSVHRGKSVAYSSNSVDFITIVVPADEYTPEPVFYHVPIDQVNGRKTLNVAPGRNATHGNATTLRWMEQFRNNWDLFKAIPLKKAA